jgi:hypothetical protein
LVGNTVSAYRKNRAGKLLTIENVIYSFKYLDTGKLNER